MPKVTGALCLISARAAFFLFSIFTLWIISVLLVDYSMLAHAPLNPTKQILVHKVTFFFSVLTPSSHPGLTEQWEIPFGEQHTSYPLITAGQGSQGKPDHGPPESFHSQKHKTQETHLEGSPKQGDIVFLTLNAMIVTIGLHEDQSEVLVCL